MRHVIAIITLALTAAATAQQPVETTPPVIPGAAPAVEVPAPAARPITFALTARSNIGFNAELDDDEGDLTVSRIGGEFGIGIPAGERGQLQLALDYEFSNYDFSGDTLIAGTNTPFEDIHRTFLSARYSRQATRQLGWFIGATAGVALEDGADTSESWEYGGVAGVKYFLSETLALGLGVGVITQLEDDPLIFPAPVVEWQIDEDWSLSAGGRPGATLTYRCSDDLSFSLAAAYESRDFRLDENGPIPGGVARESQIPIALGVRFRPSEQLELGVAAGVNLARTIEIDDEDGDELADTDADPTPFLGIEFSYRF